MIKTVIRAANDMVITFDEQGNQLTEYQGRYEDVKKKILADTGTESAFINWFGVSPKADIVEKVDW
jgi:hypothetical protein